MTVVSWELLIWRTFVLYTNWSTNAHEVIDWRGNWVLRARCSQRLQLLKRLSDFPPNFQWCKFEVQESPFSLISNCCRNLVAVHQSEKFKFGKCQRKTELFYLEVWTEITISFSFPSLSRESSFDWFRERFTRTGEKMNGRSINSNRLWSTFWPKMHFLIILKTFSEL